MGRVNLPHRARNIKLQLIWLEIGELGRKLTNIGFLQGVNLTKEDPKCRITDFTDFHGIWGKTSKIPEIKWISKRGPTIFVTGN